MKVRLGLVATAFAVMVGLFVAPVAHAEVDSVWDYRPMSLSGTYYPLVGQFGGDGATDILWYAPGTGADSLWLGNAGQRGANAFTRIPLTINKSYIPIVGDFYGDDYDDIIWYAPGTAPDAAWIATNTASHFENKAITINGTFKPTVLHDYTGLNRKDDILWYAPGSAKDYLWHMQESGAGTYSTVNLSISGTFQMVVGDWNGDRIEDVFLYAAGTAPDYRWASKADGSFSTSAISVNGTFRPVPIYQDGTGDGILWWGPGATKEAYWVRNGSTFKSIAIAPVPVRGSAVSAGLQGAIITVPDDYDGYFFGEATKGSWYSLAADAHDKGDGQLPLPGDFDGDHYIDVLWYGAGSAKDEIWYTVPPTPDRAAPAKATARATPFTVR